MNVFRAINVGWHSDLLTPAFWFLSYTGLGWVQGLFCLMLYRWPSARRFIVPGLTTIVFTGLAFAQGVKKLAPRERPSRMTFAIPQESFRDNSFLSGHTTTAFALATIVLLMTWGTRQSRIGWAAMVWACGVGVSRIYRGVHWPTDVIGGAFAGMLGSAIIYLIFAPKGWLDLTLENLGKPKTPAAS